VHGAEDSAIAGSGSYGDRDLSLSARSEKRLEGEAEGQHPSFIAHRAGIR